MSEVKLTAVSGGGTVSLKGPSSYAGTRDLVDTSGHVNLLDDEKLRLGDGNDLQIYHDGSDSYVNDAGTGSLILLSHAFKVKNAANNEAMIYANENGAVELYHDNSKKAETCATGIIMGKASDDYQDPGIALRATGEMTLTRNGDIITLRRHTTNGTVVSLRRTDGTTVGTISLNASNASFNTSSDYRLKENEVAISDGITRLKTLKPYRFNFKVTPDETVDGFFAHEVTAVPEAIIGEKDAVQSEDDDLRGIKKGDMISQTIDHSKLVPLLTAALKEAITKIETLETKVAALEAG